MFYSFSISSHHHDTPKPYSTLISSLSRIQEREVLGETEKDLCACVIFFLFLHSILRVPFLSQINTKSSSNRREKNKSSDDNYSPRVVRVKLRKKIFPHEVILSSWYLQRQSRCVLLGERERSERDRAALGPSAAT